MLSYRGSAVRPPSKPPPPALELPTEELEPLDADDEPDEATVESPLPPAE